MGYYAACITLNRTQHYGIEMPVSTMQRTTEHHAHCIYEQEVARVIGPGTAAGVFIGEMGGSMAPVVEPLRISRHDGG